MVYNRNVYVSTSNTFVNRNNYYNRNNVNVNNFNRNNINTNNINRNNINRSNVNANNYRANNFNNNARNSNFTTPTFNQKFDQPQYRNDRGNLGQGSRPGAATQPNFNQQNPRGFQSEAELSHQSESRPCESARGYGQEANRGNSNGAFSNYSPGGNARTTSARGQQSLAENRAPAGGGGNRGGGSRPQPQPARERRTPPIAQPRST